MNVELLSYTPEALELLLFTKQTRLSMDPGLMDEIRRWPKELKQKELDYMRGTIQSSWEFVDYTFLVTGVSRAFTHQLVRSRANSYAQQSQRTVDMTGFDYVVPRAFREEGEDRVRNAHSANLAHNAPGERSIYHITMEETNYAYQELIRIGANPQDARGILPTNIVTNIVVKATLRSMSDMAKLRLCTRTQGEYQDVFRLMRDRVIEVHPWADPFIRVHCAAVGVCAFPNYHECPIKGPIFNPDTGFRWDLEPAPPRTRDDQQLAWENMKPYEAVPREASK